MTTTTETPDVLRQSRHDRLLRELDHDPYHSKKKLEEPTICPECKAVYMQGRWTWAESLPVGGHQHLCPACQRIKDHVPAAFLTITGRFYFEHRDEIMNLIKNYEQRESKEHPLKRIMTVDDKFDGVVITFTDAHLARGISDALHHAYQGTMAYQYTKEDIMLRISWTRD